jgi:Tfp pilus assembly protein PilZ
MRTVKQATTPGPRKQTKVKDQVLKKQVEELVKRSRLEKNTTLPFFTPSKISTKAFGIVRSFAANTNVGTVRKSNEDRIAIILNVIQPTSKVPKV